ncbi:MAG: AmmeMemoRadiSam system protein B [Thermodesulfobacteriota bacterium]
MTSLFRAPYIVLLLLGLCLSSPLPSAAGEDIRKPVWAGKFYPDSPEELTRVIRETTDLAGKTNVRIPAGKNLKALILPHAGYVYSGLTAAHASLVLREQQFKKVILMGPDHRIGFAGCAVSAARVWESPLGRVPLHADAEKLLRQSQLFRSLPESDGQEHSLEVVLPFLQVYLKTFQLVPVVVSGVRDRDGIRTAVEGIIDGETLLVVSSDLSHFLSYEAAREKDEETIRLIIGLQSEELLKRENAACGALPIALLLDTARRHDWQPLLLHYCNSGDTAGDRSRVVGYAAIAFYEEGVMKKKKTGNSAQKFNQKQGQALVSLARRTLLERFGRKMDETAAEEMEKQLADRKFSENLANFVTLNKEGQLRGCIGSLTGTEPLLEGIRRNALNAAFNDHRFPPLSEEELETVDIEVSILTEAKPLEYQNGEDLMAKLRPNVDGVIIRKGAARATFLPQVWEQLPQPEDFLAHLCMKAGLSGDAWQNTKLEVLTYQVQYFEEKK